MEEKRKIWRDHLGDTDVHGWIILKWILKAIGYDAMDWIHLAVKREKWRVVVNPVLNLLVPLNTGDLFTIIEQLLASQRGFCSMELVSYYFKKSEGMY